MEDCRVREKTQAFEMRCYRRLFNLSYKDHVTNNEGRRKIQAAVGEYDGLLTLVKKRKLLNISHKDHVNNEEGRKKIQATIGEYDDLLTLVKSKHASRSSGLAKTILQGTMKGKRRRNRQKKRWDTISKNGQEWTLPAQLGQLKTRQD